MNVAPPSSLQAERIAAFELEAHALLDQAIDREITSSGHALAGIVTLFSGGNDSTTLAHLSRHRATHAAHANTGIGIEQTRQYVRDTCRLWGMPLLERHPRVGEGYEDLVLDRVRAKNPRSRPDARPYPGGFPGPAMHFFVYQRLKERALAQVRGELVTDPNRQRVIFLAGRRADESKRRKNLAKKDSIERRGSTVWVSPLVNWTTADLNAYRRIHPDVPRNEVSDLLHMSGECLCGAFAHSGELEEIEMWFPEVAAEIRDLEQRALKASIAPPERCRWGWGAGKETPSKVGALCTSCSARFEQPTLMPDPPTPTITPGRADSDQASRRQPTLPIALHEGAPMTRLTKVPAAAAQAPIPRGARIPLGAPTEWLEAAHAAGWQCQCTTPGKGRAKDSCGRSHFDDQDHRCRRSAAGPNAMRLILATDATGVLALMCEPCAAGHARTLVRQAAAQPAPDPAVAGQDALFAL